MNWPTNGIHEGVPFAIYRSDDITQADTLETIQGKAVSKSLIVDFIEDPGDWKRSKKKEATKDMKAGSLIDCLLLDESSFEKRYQISPYKDFRTNAAQEWRDEMNAAGIEVVTEKQMIDAHSACDAVRRNPEAAELLKGARTQVAFRHKTRFNGLSAKGLIDIVPEDPDTLVDLKKCEQSAFESHHKMRRHIYEWMYHIQSGSYLDGWNIASGEERTRFKFIFVTSTAPFRCAVIELPMAAILLGAQQYQNGVARFIDCMERDTWPSKWDGTVSLDLPEYAYTESES